MNKKFKIFFSTSLLILLTGLFFLISQPDDKLHIYFCNVGQGDGVYIRFPNGQDLLIDGGPGEKILDCLSKNMPFYDRQIDVVILTHPQADHLNGLIPVLERYRVLYFVSSPAANPSQGYQKLLALLKEKEVEIQNIYTGGLIEFGEVKFKSIWPQRDWVVEHLNCQQTGSCQTITKGEGSVLGISTDEDDLNKFSLMGILSYGSFDALFTGDADSQIQAEILKFSQGFSGSNPLEVMKVPHHGAKTALRKDFLESFKPQLAVISVGKNAYGHPRQETLDLLNGLGLIIKRTDQEGTIEVISDGKTWQVN